MDSYAVFLTASCRSHMSSYDCSDSPFPHCRKWQYEVRRRNAYKSEWVLYQLQFSSFLLSNFLLKFFCAWRLEHKTTMRASSVFCAYSQVCDVIADIKALRDNSDEEFKFFKRPQNWERTSMDRTLNCQSQGSILDKCIKAH